MDEIMSLIPRFAGSLSLLCCLHSLGFCQEFLIRTDPERDVTVQWPVAPSAIDQYTYVSVLHDGHVTLFCSDPFVVQCQVNLRQMALVRVMDTENLAVVRLGFRMATVLPPDAGDYQMEVVTSGDSSQLRDVVLYVYQEPRKPDIQGKTDVLEGDDVTLTCRSASRSEPAQYRNASYIEYTWIIRHRDVIQNRYASLNTSSVTIVWERIPVSSYGNHVIRGPVLYIYDVKKNTSLLSYRCAAREANSSLTSPESDDVTISVAYNERVTMTAAVNGDHVTIVGGGSAKPWRGQLTVAKGDNVRLSCAASCHPPCNYTWLDLSGRVEIPDSSVVLKTANCSRQIHMCKVSNTAATQTAYVYVDITEQNSTEMRSDYLYTSIEPSSSSSSSSGNSSSSSSSSGNSSGNSSSINNNNNNNDDDNSSTTNSWNATSRSWIADRRSWSSTSAILEFTSGFSDSDPEGEESTTTTVTSLRDHVLFTTDQRTDDNEDVTYSQITLQFGDILVLVLSVVAGLCICVVVILIMRWCRRRFRHQLVHIAGRAGSVDDNITKVITGSVAGRLSIDGSVDKYTESREHRISSVA